MRFESFQPKTKKELKEQVEQAEETLNAKIHPPGVFVDFADIATIQEKYKTRYDAYIASLRSLRRDGDVNEIKHAKEWIIALNNLDKYIKEHESKSNPLLREKQYIVYKKIRDFLEQGKKIGYIKLPTGTGKTILFVKIAEALGMKTLVVSPSIIILGQNLQSTQQFTNSQVGEYHGGRKDLTAPITHITYNSLINAVKNGIINPDDVPVLILDEAHRSLGSERVQTIDKFKGLKLGFTATAEFSEDRKVSKLLDEEIFRMDVAEGIREGLICQTQTIHAYTEVDLSTVDVKDSRYDQGQLEKVVNIHGRNMAAVELYQTKFSHLKALCNCSSIRHAEDVAKLFNENVISATCITGETPKEERIRILEAYKAGTIRVLTSAKVLLEGFDEPTCSVTFNLHPTLSFVDAEQRARSGRLNKDNPDKWSYVVDFIDKNSKQPQILYSEILKADRVWDISKLRVPPMGELGNFNAEGVSISLDGMGADIDGMAEPLPPVNFDDFSMKGLKIVVKTAKIMEVTNLNLSFRDQEREGQKEQWTFEVLRADVRAKNINSSEKYSNFRKQNNWPVHGALASMPEFPKNADGSNDWDTFLGRDKRQKWTFATLQADVRLKKIKSSEEYATNSRQNKWLSTTTLVLMPEFPKNDDGSNDWDTFLGREKRKEWTFETLQADVRAKAITSSVAYDKNAPQNGWPNFTSVTSMPQFPKNLSDGSNDWYTFLGRKKFDIKKLQVEVRAQGIKTSSDYAKVSSQNNWPTYNTLIAKPDFPQKSDGSRDLDTFFGREEFDLEKLRKEVISKKIKTSSDYEENAPRNNWPAPRILTSKPGFPKKPNGRNDWRAFLGKNK